MNKNISGISYNHLNLPSLIEFSDGNQIQYIYDAAGMKLQKKVTENGTTTTTNYVGMLVYDGGNR